jgi:hypothetical protein
LRFFQFQDAEALPELEVSYTDLFLGTGVSPQVIVLFLKDLMEGKYIISAKINYDYRTFLFCIDRKFILEYVDDVTYHAMGLPYL